MKTLKERRAVEKAFDEGEAIMVRSLEEKGYYGFNPTQHKDRVFFQWEYYDYRIKPKPMEFWVNVYENPKDNGYHTNKLTALGICEKYQDCIKTIKVREVTE